MKPTLRFAVLSLGLMLAMLPGSVAARAQENPNNPATAQAQATTPSELSHVRIVRLSFTEGTVTMHRPDLNDWAAAPANTPIQEGFKLSTAENSFAEVEFENTSTARLGQLTLMDFDQLAANANGGKLSRMTLEQGYGTFTVVPDLTDAFEVKAQDTTVTFAAATTSQFRVDIDNGVVRVEVFKGAAAVSSPYGQQTLTRNMVVDIRPGTAQAFNVTTGITKDAWDQWVDQREDQMAVVRNSPAPNGAGSNTYGWNDLSNYGDWSYFPGYGYGWIPSAAFGWSPYSAGQWCWYPSFGYTWISFEPWGWLPYHFGGWQFYPGMGWAWFPGSFGAWSPANVAWWQGAGGVGWSPLGVGQGGVIGGTANCPHGQTCGRVIVRPETVQRGQPVKTGLVAGFEGGKVVPKLNLPPTQTGMLPGKTFTEPASAIGSGRPQPVGGATVLTSGSNRIAVGGPGIVFNTQTGRYENNPKAQPGAPRVGLEPAPSAPASARGEAAPSRSPAWGREAAPASGGVSHSAAPSYHGSASSGSGSWGGSHSSYSGSSSGGWGGHSSAGSSGGGSWGSSGSSHGGGGYSGGSSGGSSGGFGGSSSGGGGGHSSGGGSSGGSSGGGGGPHK